MRQKLICSIDEFSLMFYNYSLNEVFDVLDLPQMIRKEDADSYRSKSGTLQAMGMDYNLEREGIMISYSSVEWGVVLRDIEADYEAFDYPLIKIRVHVHHEGLYRWFLRSNEHDFLAFELTLLHGLLACAVGTSDPELHNAFSKITRLDIAYDLLNYPESVSWLDYFSESKMLNCKMWGIKGQVANSKVTYGKSGKTLYLGSDASERKLRVYDKKAERGYSQLDISDPDSEALQTYPYIREFLIHDSISSWTRFEVELRRDESALYLPKSSLDFTFFDCPQYSFYDFIKFIHVDREGHETIENSLRDLFKIYQPVRYQKSNQIIQNDYDVQSRFEMKLKKANTWIIFARALKGFSFYQSRLAEIEKQALDPRSPVRNTLDREARREGYLSFLDLPGIDKIDLNGNIIYNFNVDEADSLQKKQDYSIDEFEQHFEQIDLLN